MKSVMKLAVVAVTVAGVRAGAQQEGVPGPGGEAGGVTIRVDAPVAPGAPAVVRLDGKRERVAHLGVVVSGAPAAMREQLKLPKGVGLVVGHVEPKSAAEAAGVKVFDVLEKWDEQWLVNGGQLWSLERGAKGGDEVSLTVVRRGARQAVKAKLIETEIDVAAMGGGAGGAPAAPRVMKVLTNGAGGVDFFNVPLPPADANVWAMRADQVRAEGDVVIRQLNGRQNTQWSDDAVSVSLAREGERTTAVTIMDRATDKLIYTGGPDGLEAVYKEKPELRAKVKQAEEAAARPVRVEFDRGELAGRPAQTVRAQVLNQLDNLVIVEPGAGNGAAAAAAIGFAGPGRGKVLRWQDDEHLLLIRAVGNQPVYLLALSRKDGRTLFEGPVMTDEQRQGVPAAVAEPLELITKRPELMREFGAEKGK